MSLPSIDNLPEKEPLVKFVLHNNVYINETFVGTSVYSSENKVLYHHPTMPYNQNHDLEPSKLSLLGSLLQGTTNDPLWTLVNKDWHDFVYQPSEPFRSSVSLSITSDGLSFEWSDHSYKWLYATNKDAQDILTCYSNHETIASLRYIDDTTELTVWSPTQDTCPFSPISSPGNLPSVDITAHNPNHSPVPSFRSLPAQLPEPLSQLTSLLVLTALVILEHNTLPQICLCSPDDMASISSSPNSSALTSLYGPNRGLVVRADSLKSIEIHPDRHRVWISWFPCCLPGGWLDFLWIKWCGPRKKERKGGWRQQS
ncbi:hypothetical protein CLU79DRAFT_715759 [Phycomyces nitens]|nr:hypothetical protein CLU79DRAFT_715759 [Phycomyces nitens]